MKHSAKLAWAVLLALTVVAGVGCGSKASAQAAKPAPLDTSDKTLRTVFASVLIGEEQMDESFTPATGIVNGKETTFMVANGKEADTVGFLSQYFWDSKAAKKEYDSLLGSQAMLDQTNAALLAYAKKNNDVKDYKPVPGVADPTKLGKNNLHDAKANYQDAKITETPDNIYIVQCKGLTYKLKKNGNAYEIIDKEGQLTS